MKSRTISRKKNDPDIDKKKIPVSQYIKLLRPCIVTYTTNTVKIESGHGTFLFSGGGERISFNEMRFIGWFREYFKKRGGELNCAQITRYAKHQTRFVKFKRTTGIHDDVIEIDINNAYPSAGRILGIIDQGLFDQMLGFKKIVGLMAIGCLHRSRRVISVSATGERKLIEKEDRDPILSDLWKSITGLTDATINKAFAFCGDDAYFYWCDAIFCKRSCKEGVVAILKDHGFDCKVKKVDSLVFDNSQATIICGGEKKPYKFPRSKKYRVENIEEVLAGYQNKIAPNPNA